MGFNSIDKKIAQENIYKDTLYNDYDPFINKEDELLNDNDREEFHKPKQSSNYYRF